MKTVGLVPLAPLETEVQPGPWELQGLKDSLATQERPESRVQLEFLVKGVLQVKMEKWDQLDLLDLRAVLETEENKDLLESPASRVYQETKARQESQGNQETWEFPESWVQWGRSDPGASEGSQEREESWETLVFRDPRASPEPPVLMGQRAAQDLPEQLEMPVPLVYKECPERGASPDPQDPKETGERSERKDLRGRLETMEPEALQDQWDQPDLQDPVEKRVNQDPKDPWDL